MRRFTCALLVATLLAAPAAAGASRRAPTLSARAAAVYDPVGERFVYGFRQHEQLAPASLAKMLVALLVAETLEPDDQVVISRRAATTRPDNMRWPEGLRLTVDDVLHAMMMESSNGAAIALAERIAGSVESFSTVLDARAAALGATRTHIVDPSGLDAPGQFSTAHDLALIAAAVLREPWLAKVVKTRTKVIPWANGGRYTLHTFNGFIVRYSGAVGVKNGYTTNAGNCLAAAARRHGRTVITVVLNDRRWFADTAALMEFGFPRSLQGELKPPPQGPPLTAEDIARLPQRKRSAPVGVATMLASFALVGTVGIRRRQVVRARQAARARAKRRVA